MNQHTLETERLILRKCLPEDLDDMFEYARDPRVGPNAGWPVHQNILETENILMEFMQSKHIWGIVWKENGKLIGTISLKRDGRRSPSGEVRELGYALSADYWGRGIMPEAVRRMMAFAFEEAGAELLTVYHAVRNSRSRRVIEKCGFFREGTLRHASLGVNGNWQDDVCYSMTRGEYQARCEREEQISSL